MRRFATLLATVAVLMAVAAPALGRDIRVLGLIGGSHFLSHFYQLSLPPLILVWRAEFGASYAALGLIVTLFALTTGLAQIPAGILVDPAACSTACLLAADCAALRPSVEELRPVEVFVKVVVPAAHL